MGRARDRPAARRRASYRWGDVAVFYRTNAQSRVLEEDAHARAASRTRSSAAPSSTTGARSRTLLAYLRAVVNPADEVSLKRVLNVPKRGVGDTSVGRLDAWANATGLTFAEALARGRGRPGVTRQGARAASASCSVLLDELARANVETGPAPVLEALLDRTGYVAELEAEHTRRGRRAAREPGRAGRLRPVSTRRVDEFLEQVSLVADTDESTTTTTPRSCS